MVQQVTAQHLQRLACLYVRQSTLQQVLENRESTARQYALQQRAVALGWMPDQIRVIDQDLGHSGASAADRAGFQWLMAEVGLGYVGLVMGLEVSRLARSSSDWHRLLEICALSDTLILDEDGLYDSATFNDRLLLGLKGTMSEAELYVLRARLQGGILNKAKRGALKLHLPVGFRYAEGDAIILDPHQQVQETLHTSFGFSARWVQPAPPCVLSDSSRSPSPAGCAAGRIKANWCGVNSATMMSCVSCIIRAMQAPTFLDAHGPGKGSTARSTLPSCPARTGRSSCRRPMPVTSAGRSTNGTWRS
jgi:DNA invertase Pin-like site-specific DNA recombinase